MSVLRGTSSTFAWAFLVGMVNECRPSSDEDIEDLCEKVYWHDVHDGEEKCDYVTNLPSLAATTLKITQKPLTWNRYEQSLNLIQVCHQSRVERVLGTPAPGIVEYHRLRQIPQRQRTRDQR